jgi:hypothetical protein
VVHGAEPSLQCEFGAGENELWPEVGDGVNG